jgi:hypothetical protein
MRTILAAGALLMTMSACAAVPPPPGGEDEVRTDDDPRYVCKAERAQHLVGRPSSQELGAETVRLTGARTLRWIPEGGIVTMDYRTDRVNVELDRQNRVTRIRCG